MSSYHNIAYHTHTSQLIVNIIIVYVTLGGPFVVVFQCWKYPCVVTFCQILEPVEVLVVCDFFICWFWKAWFHKKLPCLLMFINVQCLAFDHFYTLVHFELILIFPSLKWSRLQSCIIKSWIQATGASTTGGLCFVWYTEYNTQGIHENSKLLFFSFEMQKSWEHTLRQEWQTHARCLWNRWFYETWFPGVWRLVFLANFAVRRVVRQIARKGIPRECNGFEYKWESGNHTETKKHI